MASPIEERLLAAIEKDDIKAFSALMEEAPCGGLRLGRFPVLSLMYLYGARKLIAAHEEKFLKVPTWKELREPASVAKRFAERAGKCLRLFTSEIVSPLEMLLILDETKRLKKAYPSTRPSAAIKARLQSIYSVKYSLEIQFEGNDIILEKRPLNRREKRKILAICLSCVLALVLVVATPVTTVTLFAKRGAGEVSRLSQINFAAQTSYTLKRDIKIPDGYSVDVVNCSIDGNGHTLTFGKGATLGELDGTMSNLEIRTAGSPIFTLIAPNAGLSNVTVHVNADLTSNASNGFIALGNYGTLDGVTLNVSGSLSATGEGMSEGVSELIFGGLVAENVHYTRYSQNIYGTIKNCNVHYSNFSLHGELSANATFGGVVGINNGFVQNCKVTGDIAANTFDLGGVCYINGNQLTGITNEANLKQISSTADWTPIVGGIAIENASVVEYCVNRGNIDLEGAESAICGGIAARTYGQTNYCYAGGDITVKAKLAYAGSIFGRSEVVFNGMGGLCGFAAHCIGEGTIKVTLGEEESCIGGIGGFMQEGVSNKYKYDDTGHLVYDENGNPVVESVEYVCGGGITDCFFTGTLTGTGKYLGSIVGVCAKDIYDTNTYTSDKEERANFEGNYYVKGASSAFGAALTVKDEFLQVADKGATAATEREVKAMSEYDAILGVLGLKQS